MSLADRVQELNDGLLDAYTSVQTKGGTVPAQKNLDNLPDAIESISGGGSSDFSKMPVRFFDYKGNLVGGYEYDELASLTELPPLPTPSDPNIMAVEWNYTLAEVKAVVSPVKIDVGETCQSAVNGGNDTLLYIAIGSSATSITLNFSQTVSGGVTIDWGDGSTTETVEGTGVVNSTAHEYETLKDYIIKLTPSANCELGLGGNSKNILNGNGNALRKAIVGRAILNDYAFFQMKWVNEVIIPPASFQDGSIKTYSFRDNAFRYITVPRGVLSIVLGAFYGNTSMKNISLPNTITSLDRGSFSNPTNLRELRLPESLATAGISAGSAISGLTALTDVYLPSSAAFYKFESILNGSQITEVLIPANINSIPQSSFSSCFNLYKIIFRDRNSFSSIMYLLSSENEVRVLDFSDFSQVPTAHANLLANLSYSAKIVVPDALYSDWIVASVWSDRASQIVKASEYQEDDN